VYDVIKTHTGPESPDLKVTDWSQHRTKRLHIENDAEPSPTVSVTIGESDK